MNILVFSPKDMTTEATIAGLQSLPHTVTLVRMNDLPRPIDRTMLDVADAVRPELIVQIGDNNPPHLAAISTLQRLKGIAPTVLLSFDGVEQTWRALLEQYRDRAAYSLVCNIDGNHDWPCRPGVDITALTPVDPGFYLAPPPLDERPVAFGFAGGLGSQSRRDIVGPLLERAGLVIPKRNETYGSYRDYAHFLMSCQVVLNLPLCGSDNAMQVKGRVVEAGLAGCVLLEHNAAPTDAWFDMGRDYFTWNTVDDIIAHLAELRGDPALGQRVADRLRHKVLTQHGPTVFWTRIFERLGL